MTQLEASMAFLMKIFDTYAGKEGKVDTLTKAEVKTLLESEMPGMLKGAKNQDEVDKLFKNLDFDGDGEVDFSEFMVLVTVLACAFHGRFSEK